MTLINDLVTNNEIVHEPTQIENVLYSFISQTQNRSFENECHTYFMYLYFSIIRRRWVSFSRRKCREKIIYIFYDKGY